MNAKHFNTAKSFGDLITEFETEIDTKPGTAKLYGFLVWKFHRFMQVKGFEPREPEPRHLLFYKRHLLETGHRVKYVNLCLAALRQFFRWMEAKQYFSDPTTSLKSVKQTETFQKEPLLAADVRKLFAVIDTTTARGLRDTAMILLMFQNGLRLSEVISTRLQDYRPPLLAIMGKARHQKETIVLTTEVQQAINSYLEATELKRLPDQSQIKTTISKAKGLALITHTTPTDQPLFLTHSRSYKTEPQPLTRQDATRVINKHLAAAGLKKPNVSAHSLRHGAATELILHGRSLHEVSLFLRHHDTKTTRIYTQIAERVMKQSDELQSLLSNLISR